MASPPSPGCASDRRACDQPAGATMLPSALAAHAGAYWDVVASSALFHFPAAPGFGNLGKSFLIENLLRAGGAPPPGLQPPPPHGPAAALATATATATAGAQVRPLPASPVPLKLCPAAEPASPGGAPYGPRWAFQVLSPSADGARLPGRPPGDRDCTFHPSAPGECSAWDPGTPGSGRACEAQSAEGAATPGRRNLPRTSPLATLGVRRVTTTNCDPPTPSASHATSFHSLLFLGYLGFQAFGRNPEGTPVLALGLWAPVSRDFPSSEFVPALSFPGGREAARWKVPGWERFAWCALGAFAT